MILKIRETMRVWHTMRVLYMKRILRCMKVWEILIMENVRVLKIYVRF